MEDAAFEPEMTPALVAAHGLDEAEWERLVGLVGRPPTLTELGIVSAMWNEHCSYKSTRRHLRTLFTEGPQVVHGPGENAGVVDIGDGQVVVFKMESHNHPSFIEPTQGAATGMGGILRDVFTMGARPVAAMNALSFGDPDPPPHSRSRLGRGGGDRRLRQRFRRADRGGRGALPPRLLGEHPRQRLRRRHRGPGRDLHVGCLGRRAARGLSRRQDRARRGRRRDHGLDGLRRCQRLAAPHRAGRRPVHREAASGGVPGIDGYRRGGRDPGHGRCGPDLLGGRDGRQGGPRHPPRARRGARARGGDDRLRDDAVGEPGAHADGAAPGEGSRGAGRVRALGSRLRHGRRDDPRRPLRDRARRRRGGGPAALGPRRKRAGVRPSMGAHAASPALRGRPRPRADRGAAAADRAPEPRPQAMGVGGSTTIP